MQRLARTPLKSGTISADEGNDSPFHPLLEIAVTAFAVSLAWERAIDTARSRRRARFTPPPN
jgi:hypothetical protein